MFNLFKKKYTDSDGEVYYAFGEPVAPQDISYQKSNLTYREWGDVLAGKKLKEDHKVLGYTDGKKKYDIMYGPGIPIISQRVVDIMTGANVTGVDFVEIRLREKDKRIIKGYFIMQIKGRIRYVSTSKNKQFGFGCEYSYLGEKKDTTDIMIFDIGGTAIITTPKVKKLFEDNNITGASFKKALVLDSKK